MNKTKILIVEDEAIVAADLASRLKQMGYEVAGITAGGEEAVLLACRLRPQLVLMDILLEGQMDGIEAAETIRRLHDVPVIYLTAHSDAATLARAKLTRPFGYILKPFEEQELGTQIELALYKHRFDRELREQREWLRVTLTSIGDAVIATNHAGCITFINPVAESLTGWKAEDAVGQPASCVFCPVNEQTGKAIEEPVTQVLRDGRAVVLANHATLVTKDGRTVPVEDSAAPILNIDGQVIGVVLVFHDVTKKRSAENERETAVEFLHLVNESKGTDGLVHAATDFFQRKTGCDAVAIRLRREDDYPYYESRGFSSEFVLLESRLCSRDKDGRPVLDSMGSSVLECMCGNVISGRFDPLKPFFTLNGSFWTNCTTELLAAGTETDRHAYNRNRCNREGYESVALIALRVGENRLGLLQLNDKRRGHFTPENIALWEKLAGYLAVALAKTIAEEALAKEKDTLKTSVKERTEELERVIDALWAEMTERERADTALKEANETLERRVTERTEELGRLNRILQALGHNSKAVMRAMNENEYLKEACRIVVEDCGYAMVWIGFAEEDEAKSIRPVAHFGFEEGYLETLKITWSDTEWGQGPTGIAVRTGKPAMCRNMLTDPKFQPWRTEAIKRGYASSIVLPLLNGEKAFGAINIYSRETDPFSGNEVRLLSELADDMAYGVSVIRLRAAHVRTEESLRQKGSELADAQRIAHIGSWYWDAKTDTITGSDELMRIYGFDSSMVFFPTFSKQKERCFPIEDWERINTNAWKSLKTGLGYELEARLIRHGAHIWVTIRSEVVRDTAGQIVGLRGTVQDITERKRAQQQLIEINETLERRVLERTTEVQRLAVQLRALASDLCQTEQRERKRLAMILHDHIQQLLVAAMLQLGLINRADKKALESTVQGVESTIKEAIDASRSLAVELSPPIVHQAGLAAGLNWLAKRMEEKHLFAVHVQADHDAEPTEESMRFLLFESIRELLLNSVKHSGVQEARVTMVRTKDSWTKVIVEDKGRGFDVTGIQAHYDSASGFGLFSIQQRLVHLGGWLEIEGAPGCGTRIIMSIPPEKTALPAQRPADISSAIDNAENVPLSGKDRKIRVLIVDDHRIMRQGLAGILKSEADIEVVAEAENGRKAVELARLYKPDVVIMDVNMPIMNGIEATQIVTRELPQSKVIGLSMHIDKDIAAAMHKAGAVGYLTKGAQYEDLIAAIRACRKD